MVYPGTGTGHLDGGQAGDHLEHNGTSVNDEGNGNLQTRLGLRTFLKGHNNIDDGKNQAFQPFLEVNWIHNMEKYGTRMGNVSVS